MGVDHFTSNRAIVISWVQCVEESALQMPKPILLHNHHYKRWSSCTSKLNRVHEVVSGPMNKQTSPCPKVCMWLSVWGRWWVAVLSEMTEKCLSPHPSSQLDMHPLTYVHIMHTHIQYTLTTGTRRHLVDGTYNT